MRNENRFRQECRWEQKVWRIVFSGFVIEVATERVDDAYISIQPSYRRGEPTRRRWESHLYVKPHLHVAKLSPNYSGHCLPFWRGRDGEIARDRDTYRESTGRTETETEKSGERGACKPSDSRIRSALRDRSSLQLAKLLACDARRCYYATPAQTLVTVWRKYARLAGPCQVDSVD